MKKNGKYRFSLQFGMDSDEEILAGELLERLGNKKSKVIIAAINEYVANHPDMENNRSNVTPQTIPMSLLETKIKEVFQKQTLNPTSSPGTNSKREVDPIEKDLADMLEDLDLF